MKTISRKYASTLIAMYGPSTERSDGPVTEEEIHRLIDGAYREGVDTAIKEIAQYASVLPLDAACDKCQIPDGIACCFEFCFKGCQRLIEQEIEKKVCDGGLP